MCGRAIVVPREVVEQLVQDIIRRRTAELFPDWPAVWGPAKSVRPTDVVSVITTRDAGGADSEALDSEALVASSPAREGLSALTAAPTLDVKDLRWGYEASWAKGPLFNTKFETATKTDGFNMWRDSLLNRRCVIPTLGFFETHHSETFINPRSGKPNKQQYLFKLPDEPITYLAGIFEGDKFSVMTTEPNASVKPVHNRMPVVLGQMDIFTWLEGDFASLQDRSAVELSVEKESQS